MRNDAAHELSGLLKATSTLEKLIINFNDIGVQGAKSLSSGL